MIIRGWYTGLILSALFLGDASAQNPMISLVDALTLSQASDSVHIIDARREKSFSKGHIPKAKSFYWRSHTHPKTAKIPYALVPMAQITRALADLGIRPQSQIIIYGEGDKGFGEEGWVAWLLVHLGHRGPIQLLRGGFKAWKQKDFPLSRAQPPQGSRTIEYRAQSGFNVMANFEDLCPQRAQIIDTRNLWERARGKIPGAVAIHWKKFFAPDGQSPLPANELNKLLVEKGINGDKPCVYYCTGGIRSAWAWLVHTMAGFSPAQNYAGGMADYAHHTARQKRPPCP